MADRALRERSDLMKVIANGDTPIGLIFGGVPIGG